MLLLLLLLLMLGCRMMLMMMMMGLMMGECGRSADGRLVMVRMVQVVMVIVVRCRRAVVVQPERGGGGAGLEQTARIEAQHVEVCCGRRLGQQECVMRWRNQRF